MKKENYKSPILEKIDLSVKENVSADISTDNFSEKGWGEWKPI